MFDTTKGNDNLSDDKENDVNASNAKSIDLQASDFALLDKEAIEKKVEKTIEGLVKKENRHKIQLSAELTTDLEMDSLSLMELLMELDELMGIETGQDTAQKLTTVQKVIDYVWENIQKNKNTN